MRVQEIEAELDKLTLEELRRLALKSWSAFVIKESAGAVHECDEDDPSLLAALDESAAEAEEHPDRAYPIQEARRRLAQWI